MAEAGESAPAVADGGGAPSAPSAPTPTGNLDVNSGAGSPSSGLAGPPDDSKPAPAPPGPKPAASKPAGDPAPKPAAAAKDAPAKATTIADAPAPDPDAPKPPTPADWPEDWRAKAAGDNKKALDRLARFKSPAEVVNSYITLEQKLSSGEYTKKLPTRPTDQELADYRKSNNIPDKPEDYNVNLPGIVWGEADKPMLDSWRQFAHENNLSPDLVKLGPAWYAREQEAIVARLEQDDMHNFQAGSEALRAEWGQEFKGNINAAKNLFEAHPGMWETVMSARGPDGMKNGDNPAVLKAFAAMAREMNPFATIAPTSVNSDPAKTVDARLGEINKMMGNKQGPYWKGPDAMKIQQEYRDLLEMKDRASARGQRAA